MVFRAWYAIPERLTTSTGKDSRGAYGFLTTFLRVIREHSPSHIAVTFDTKAPTFRDEIFHCEASWPDQGQILIPPSR